MNPVPIPISKVDFCAEWPQWLIRPVESLAMISSLASWAPAGTHICATRSPLLLSDSMLPNYVTWVFPISLFTTYRDVHIHWRHLKTQRKELKYKCMCVEWRDPLCVAVAGALVEALDGNCSWQHSYCTCLLIGLSLLSHSTSQRLITNNDDESLLSFVPAFLICWKEVVTWMEEAADLVSPSHA